MMMILMLTLVMMMITMLMLMIPKKKLADKLVGVAGKVADSVILKLAERGQKPIV